MKSRFSKLVCLISLTFTMMIVSACGNSQETSGSEQELPSFKLTISNFMPDKHSFNVGMMKPLAEKITEGTNGRIQATVFSGGALGKPKEHFNMAVQGVSDVSILIHGYTPGKFPATQVGELPFIVPYEAANAENITEVLWELKDKFKHIAEDHKGTKILALFSGDPAILIFKDKEVETLEDLNGLKIRTPSSSASKIIEGLGGVPINMPMPDVYDAMQKGVIDGALATGSSLKSFRLYDVATYIVDTRLYGSPFGLVMHNNTYDKFQGQDKKLLDSLTTKELSLKAAKDLDTIAKESLEAAISKGVKVRDLTPEEIKKLEEIVQPIIQEWIKEVEKEGIPGKKMYQEAVRLGEELSKQ
jgi:TRAP-type C4-dicarboxylate transport system substrate-binding protein